MLTDQLCLVFGTVFEWYQVVIKDVKIFILIIQLYSSLKAIASFSDNSTYFWPINNVVLKLPWTALTHRLFKINLKCLTIQEIGTLRGSLNSIPVFNISIKNECFSMILLILLDNLIFSMDHCYYEVCVFCKNKNDHVDMGIIGKNFCLADGINTYLFPQFSQFPLFSRLS